MYQPDQADQPNQSRRAQVFKRDLDRSRRGGGASVLGAQVHIRCGVLNQVGHGTARGEVSQVHRGRVNDRDCTNHLIKLGSGFGKHLKRVAFGGV